MGLFDVFKKKSGVNELVECDGCGYRHQKSVMRKCPTCGAVLCPSCRKHHSCETVPRNANTTRHSEEVEEWFRNGEMYRLGTALSEPDHETAIYWYTMAAERGHAEAQYYLGEYYYYGISVPKDLDKAIYWFKKADCQGHADTPNYIGMCYSSRGDYASAMPWFKKGAERGESKSQFMLGVGYYYGEGVRKDEREAAFWFQKAAEQGDEIAADRLGWCYSNIGKYHDALIWFERAAELGYGDAQAEVATRYLAGMGTDRDVEKALYWLHKGAEQENPKAQVMLGCFYMDGELLPQDLERGFRLIKASAESKKAEASTFFILGRCYCEGLGVQRDLNQARYWIGKAAELSESNNELREYINSHPEL